MISPKGFSDSLDQPQQAEGGPKKRHVTGEAW